MSGSKPPPEGKQPDRSADEPETAQDAKSGRVTFDSRGNAVWEWSMATGAFGREVDTKRLEKLEAKDLKIVDEPAKPTGKALTPTKPDRGSDPYNSAAGPVVPPKGANAPSKPTDLRRLSEWIKQQKALGKKVGKE